MNNRFKFRGYWYNNVQKEWWVYDEPEFITGNGTAEIWSNTEGGAEPELPPNADLYLCQCTGLKDKNGKLIYEGDIVQIFHVSGTMQGRLFTDVVEWNEQRCRFDTENYGVFDDDDVYEVIGNIYENKELLESEG